MLWVGWGVERWESELCEEEKKVSSERELTQADGDFPALSLVLFDPPETLFRRLRLFFWEL